MKSKFLLILLALALILTVSCASKDSTSTNQIVKIGVVGSIYEDIWKPAQEALQAEGITLQIVQFSDYVTPNNALANGEVDLNSFQHRIYLAKEIESNGYAIQNIGNTFIQPLNLYSNKIKNVSELKDGDVIAIPNDVTNGGRALKVLENAGILKLSQASGFNPTLQDIESKRVDIEIKELAANTISAALPDITAGVINGNYALDFGFKIEDAIFVDEDLSEPEYWNLIAARTEDLKDPAKADLYKKIVESYQSAATDKVYKEKFVGFLIPVGWDEDLFLK